MVLLFGLQEYDVAAVSMLRHYVASNSTRNEKQFHNEQTTFSSPKTTVNPKLPAFSTIFASTLSPMMIFSVQAVPVAHPATVTVSLDAHLPETTASYFTSRLS